MTLHTENSFVTSTPAVRVAAGGGGLERHTRLMAEASQAGRWATQALAVRVACRCARFVLRLHFTQAP